MDDTTCSTIPLCNGVGCLYLLPYAAYTKPGTINTVNAGIPKTASRQLRYEAAGCPVMNVVTFMRKFAISFCILYFDLIKRKNIGGLNDKIIHGTFSERTPCMVSETVELVETTCDVKESAPSFVSKNPTS